MWVIGYIVFTTALVCVGGYIVGIMANRSDKKTQ
jgi:hypothetical protein